ncbi:toprim domain-containing protein [Ethanoligenens sp.]|uniref:toprim domain-containing protein n=1 Tax=Ethanoligenens sp. TaxID=2099655 RepID=UPI0039EA05C4
MIHIREAVIVEGKYDKIKLSSLIDAVIIETDGFAIFKNAEKLALIRRLAEKRGVLIITDSDAAGFKIRGFLNGALPPGQVKHAYMPDIFGKERRKVLPSKEGKLGVEGIPPAAIMESLARAGVLAEQAEVPRRRVTKADLFADGLSGGEQSAVKRRAFLKKLRLPQRLSANGLLDVLNAMYSYEEYKQAVAEE